MTRTFLARNQLEFYAEPLGRQVLEAEVAMLLDMLPDQGRVLSLGCGVGAHEAALRRCRPALDIVCLDVDEGMLAEVPAHLPRVRADMRALPFAGGSFDAVYALTSLGFAPDPEVALREAARLLAPRGTLFVLALNPSSGGGRARFRGGGPTWGDADQLVGMVGRATGGSVEVSRDIWVAGESLGPRGRGEDAALLVVRSVGMGGRAEN